MEIKVGDKYKGEILGVAEVIEITKSGRIKFNTTCGMRNKVWTKKQFLKFFKVAL